MVEDEQATFLNPAGLAGVPRYSINYANLDVEVSADTIGNLSNTGAFNNMSVSTLNTLMGKDTYARVQVSPSIVMPSFGLAALVDVQGAVLAKKPVAPADQHRLPEHLRDPGRLRSFAGLDRRCSAPLQRQKRELVVNEGRASIRRRRQRSCGAGAGIISSASRSSSTSTRTP